MLERIAIVEFKHQFDSEIDRPAFDYIDICHVWTQLREDKQQQKSMLHLEQAPISIIGKRVSAKPLTEGAAFKKLNEKDSRMGVQSYLTSGILVVVVQRQIRLQLLMLRTWLNRFGLECVRCHSY